MNSNEIKKNIYKLIVFIFFILNYFIFYLSLEKCYDGVDKCCMKLDWIKKKIIEECISIFLTVILFLLMIFKKISKLHLIHFSIVFFAFYKYSYGLNFDDHGYYNIKYYFIISITILLFLYLTKYLLSIKNKKIIFVYTLLTMMFYTEFFVNSYFGCNDWGKGLNNTYIDNNKNKYGCLIKIPKSFAYKIGKYFFDVFKTYSPNCYKKALNSREKLLKYSKSPYINNNTLHFGIPVITKDENVFHKENYNLLYEYISKHLIDMNIIQH